MVAAAGSTFLFLAANVVSDTVIWEPAVSRLIGLRMATCHLGLATDTYAKSLTSTKLSAATRLLVLLLAVVSSLSQELDKWDKQVVV